MSPPKRQVKIVRIIHATRKNAHRHTGGDGGGGERRAASHPPGILHAGRRGNNNYLLSTDWIMGCLGSLYDNDDGHDLIIKRWCIHAYNDLGFIKRTHTHTFTRRQLQQTFSALLLLTEAHVANLLLDNLARRWGAGQAKLKTKDLMAQGEMSGGWGHAFAVPPWS